jgi:hypothetical protein
MSTFRDWDPGHDPGGMQRYGLWVTNAAGVTFTDCTVTCTDN